MFIRHRKYRYHMGRPRISLLIPFTTKSKMRQAEFEWLLKYWEHELPDAEIVVGTSRGRIFCKGEALNEAARRSTGRVMVILDADAYLPGTIISKCADRIIEETDLNHPLWYVPYRHLYRLKKEISKEIIASDPTNPLRLSSPPPMDDVENGQQSTYGHRYGAMIMMFPREAYEVIRGFDERFRGWGGEDIALLRALDTLYGKHKTVNADILHLWHPTIGDTYKTRMWKNQRGSQPNSKLAMRYHRASRNREEMQKIVDEGYKARTH
jgi:N-terminal domain of galactosyltransferase